MSNDLLLSHVREVFHLYLRVIHNNACAVSDAKDVWFVFCFYSNVQLERFCLIWCVLIWISSREITLVWSFRITAKWWWVTLGFIFLTYWRWRSSLFSTSHIFVPTGNILIFNVLSAESQWHTAVQHLKDPFAITEVWSLSTFSN